MDSERTVRIGPPDRTVPMPHPGARQPVPSGPVLVVSAAVRPPAPVVVAAAPNRASLVERVNPVQLACWQVALLAVVLAARAPGPVLIGAIAGAAVLFGLTGIRVRGRWGYQLAGLWLGFRLRPRQYAVSAEGALLGALLPGSTIRTVRTGEDPVAAISHSGGLTAMIRPESLPAERIAGFPAPAALLPDGPHELGVQTVFHSGTGTGTRVWLAVHAARTVDAVLDKELDLLLYNALRRVSRSLKRAGVPTEPLPPAAALAVVTGLVHVSGGRNEVREDWTFVRTGPVSQACFTLEGWHRLAADHAGWLVPHLLGWARGVAVTVALSARSADGSVRSDAVLRLAATTEGAVEFAAGGVADLLAPAGVGLTRLDGCHLFGMAASLPIGAFPG